MSRLRLRQRLRHLRAVAEPPPESFDALLAEGIVQMGPHSYGEPDVAVWRSVDGDLAGDPVIIGDYCSIANDVVLLTGGNHRTDWVSTFPFRIRNDLPGKGRDGQIYSNGELRIGNDVWIGRGALITSGVTVGHGAVIAADAVVARDVPPYTVVAGNPARVVRERFTAEQTEALLDIAWWDWPDDVVGEHVDLLLSPDIDAFIAAARTTGARLAQASARS